MTRRSWLGFLVLAAITVGAAFGLGVLNSDRNDPLPREVLRPGETIEFQGSRFTLVSFGPADLPPDIDVSEYPGGAEFVRLVLEQEVISVPDDPYLMSCGLQLRSDLGRWDDDGSLAYSAGWPSDCHRGPGSEELTAGSSHEVNGLWVVPAGALDGARVVVHFASTRASFEVRP